MILIHLADIHLRKGSSKFKTYEDVINNLFRKVDEIEVGDKMFVVCETSYTICKHAGRLVVQLSQFIRGMAPEVKLWSSRVTMIIILHADTDAPYDILGALINALDLIPSIISTTPVA
jgi:hypothetical protein